MAKANNPKASNPITTWLIVVAFCAGFILKTVHVALEASFGDVSKTHGLFAKKVEEYEEENGEHPFTTIQNNKKRLDELLSAEPE